MTVRKQMYGLLEQMVDSAAERDKDSVLKLNDSFEALVPKVYHDPITQLDLQYDNCRQSCVLSVTMFEDQYERLVSDAKARFSKIPKPVN